MKTSASLPSSIASRAALVTGAAGQLGRAIVAALAERGARVAALDLPGSGVAELFPPEGDILACPCDLLDAKAATAAVDAAIERLGKLSILVNAAGLIRNEPLVDIAAPYEPLDLASFRQVIDANLTSAYAATAIVARRMVATRSRGIVVTLSSVAAEGNAGQAAYSAAKAGLNAATAAWAKELGLLGIRFVAVAPGFIDVPTTHAALSQSVLGEWLRRTPTRSLGTQEDVISAVLFAIENPHLNGKVLSLDGGLTL